MCEPPSCWRNWKTFCLFEVKEGKYECCINGCVIGIFIMFGVIGILAMTHISNKSIDMSDWTEIYKTTELVVPYNSETSIGDQSTSSLFKNLCTSSACLE